MVSRRESNNRLNGKSNTKVKRKRKAPNKDNFQNELIKYGAEFIQDIQS